MELIIICFVLFIISNRSIRLVKIGQVMVVECFGKFSRLLEHGINIINPFTERVVRVIDLKQQVMNMTPQLIITRDNCSVMVGINVFYSITDLKNILEFNDSEIRMNLTNKVIEIVRDLIGRIDEWNIMSSKEFINMELTQRLGEEIQPFGVNIDRAEIREVIGSNYKKFDQ